MQEIEEKRARLDVDTEEGMRSAALAGEQLLVRGVYNFDRFSEKMQRETTIPANRMRDVFLKALALWYTHNDYTKAMSSIAILILDPYYHGKEELMPQDIRAHKIISASISDKILISGILEKAIKKNQENKKLSLALNAMLSTTMESPQPPPEQLTLKYWLDMFKTQTVRFIAILSLVISLAIFLLVAYNAPGWREEDRLIFALIAIPHVINILYLCYSKQESYLSLFMKRKALEEEAKIKELES